MALGAFLALLGLGVVRRWRWVFWLVLVAFLAGVLRVPVSLLELAGGQPAEAPTWYLLVQGGLGLLQFALGLALLAGYRRAGVWGAGWPRRGGSRRARSLGSSAVAQLRRRGAP